ncbi:outer membrane beta-barrel protein [Rhodobacterales bacterium HKCCE2091]|nr:outer membrane beta-barrel protein [Rhodobacterales bacterium HKCCE2091]
MFKILAPAALAAITLATAASAQSPADAFAGFYGGVELGYNSADYGNSMITVDLGSAPNAGLFFGYNHALGSNWIVGAEFDYMTEARFGNVGGGGTDIILQDTLGISGRAGYVFGDMMAYGTVGYMNTELANNSGSYINADGITYGLGLEWMFQENMSARIEYERMDLDIGGAADFRGDRVSLGVAMHF